MVGPSGSGKSMAWHVLLKALERLEGVEGVAHAIDPKVCCTFKGLLTHLSIYEHLMKFFFFYTERKLMKNQLFGPYYEILVLITYA